jgi:2-oxoglutarate dehydrogenase E1 component
VIDDDTVDPSKVRRVLLCSGKVYYDLLDKRDGESKEEVAILRIEQFYPFPVELLRRALTRYRKAKDWVWVQEESLNMGGWSFMEPRLRAMDYPVKYVGRDASASPATGSHHVHVREQKELVEAALRKPVPHLVRATASAAQTPLTEWQTALKTKAQTVDR